MAYFEWFYEKRNLSKFCVASISSHEVMKLQSFESGLSGVAPTNVRNISSMVFFAYFC